MNAHRQQHIARVVRSIGRKDIPADAGSCVWRATVGKVVLAEHNIESDIVIGAAAFGATPDLTLRFCLDDYTASMAAVPGLPHHSRMHAWLHVPRGDLAIDFSTAYWGLQHWNIAFTVEPPIYVWTKRRTVSRKPPPLGRTYYGEPIDAAELQARIANDVAPYAIAPT
jgi:hypothetical protein